MTQIRDPGHPTDLSPVRQRFGQVPSWETNYQELLYRCPQCSHLFLFSSDPRQTRQARSKALRDPKKIIQYQQAFEADLTRIPKKLCPLCSYVKYHGEYRLLEQVVAGEHLGYLFQYVSADGPNSLIQVRRHNLVYRPYEVEMRWPYDREHLQEMIDWLRLRGVPTLWRTSSTPLIAPSLKKLEPHDLEDLPFDIYDGQRPSRSLHWEGTLFRYPVRDLYPGDGMVVITMVTAAMSGRVVSHEELGRLWVTRLSQMHTMLQEYPH